MNEFYHKTKTEGENMARPMTMAEKILAAHAGLEEVVPGQLIECDLDLVLSNDVTAPIAIKEFKKVGVDKVFDPKIFLSSHRINKYHTSTFIIIHFRM